MSKITISQLHMALCEANSIMLTVHIRPDGDAIGSMVAFYEALVGQGKTVYMVVDDVVPEKRILKLIQLILICLWFWMLARMSELAK